MITLNNEGNKTLFSTSTVFFFNFILSKLVVDFLTCFQAAFEKLQSGRKQYNFTTVLS